MVDVAVIGAGLAGLQCARTLEAAGVSVALFEAAEAPGGRVRTDTVDGFRLDRGFQVLLTAYPETEQALDYGALDLCPLRPGALVHHGGRFHRFADPFREPLKALRFALDGVVPLRDKMLVAKLRRHTLAGDAASVFEHPEKSTRILLEQFGFSPAIVERFFVPFFGGVFLERELATSSRFFEFLFRMFAAGAVAVPRAGMQALPDQLASRLKPGTLRLSARVEKLTRAAGSWNILAAGEQVEASTIVLAIPGHEAALLLGTARNRSMAKSRAWNRTTTFYYSADRAPVEEPVIVLNGDGRAAGPVNNLAVMSRVSRDYAPGGAELIAASVVGEAPQSDIAMMELDESIRAQLSGWFGAQVKRWSVLAAYPIPYALPLTRTAQWHSGPIKQVEESLFLSGDWQETPSLQGALLSGRRVAETILTRTKVKKPAR